MDICCRKCGIRLVPIINWYPSSQKKNDYICISCTRKRNKEYHKKNRDERKKYKKDNYWKLRKELINHLGGRCKLCGETDYQFITLHHSVPMNHDCQPYHYQKYLDIIVPLCWKCHDKIRGVNNWLNIKEIYYG